MPIQDYGTVCDISVLTGRQPIEKAQNFFQSSGLYIPNSTYSWLSRSKLIEVRHQAVKYSLVSELVREREIYPAHLPEIYDEIGRQIMFETNHNVALTDLRGLLLSAHLQLPILTFDEDLLERVSKEIGIRSLWSLETHADWLSIRNLLGFYRELSFDSGRKFYEQLENGNTFPQAVDEIENSQKENFRKTEESTLEISQGKTNPGILRFQYLLWDIMPSIQEYYEQSILPPQTIRQICERCVILVAEPIESEKPEQESA